MTRELNFRQSFSSQFQTATGFKPVSIADLSLLAPSDFPSFAVSIGGAKYTTLDPLGNPSGGEQDFLLTVYFSVPETSPETLLQYRSDYLSLAEQCVSGYVPPAPASGENYRIAKAEVVKIEAQALSKSMRRCTIAINSKYLFTML